MPGPAPSTATPTPPSIRTLSAAFVVLPVLVVSTVLVLLIWGASRRTAESLATTMTDHAAVMVADNVRTYLDDAVRLSDLYARRLHDATLSPDDLPAWRTTMLQDLTTSPDAASICFGTPDGRATYLQRANGRLEFGLGLGPGPDQCTEHQITPEGQLLNPPLRIYQYDPTQRPWYTAALLSRSPTWTPIYVWFADQTGDAVTGAGYTRPIFAPPNPAQAANPALAPNLLGVLTIDVTLSALSDFLLHVPAAQDTRLFIVDAHGHLVASTEGNVTDADGSRLPLERSASPAARAAAAAILRTRPPPPADATTTDPATPAAIVGSQNARVQTPQGPARVAVTSITPYRGLDWRLVTVIPESAFMADARSALTRSLLVAAVAVVAAALLGLRLSSRLAHPIMALRTHMTRLARGEFDIPLNLHAARELQDLSRDINAAARDLKNHVEVRHSLELAMQVQKSLLPDQPPKPPGLDLAGKSTYCDQTGGDYYDFLDVLDLTLTDNPSHATQNPRPATLIVVGDVMGHGVAAALLMATARATLRLRARQPASLGRILTDVNRVLAPDFREGRFMTMALLLIDPLHRRARWASAGHDAPIVYEPTKDAFRELSGGDVPLGVLDGTEYRDEHIDDLDPGSLLVIGTDGIWEAATPDGEQFGHQRLRAILRQNATRPAADIARAIDDALKAFLGPERPKDDVTYAIARLTNPA